ncbi:MAG: TonB-dependent receptor [Halopseudomonas sp.]
MLYFKSLPLAALSLLPLAIAPTVSAETQSGQLVVTATRMAQTTDQTLVPVSVITREDIEKSPAVNLPELLSQLPGVDFSTSGGRGATSSLFMRGTNSNHTLVLIDGVKIGSATLGSTPFEDIPLAQIERVEVVRGPRSSLYGSEAIGGVIQIFTKKPTQGVTATAKLGAGNHETRDASAGLSMGSERGSFAVNLAHFTTNGIDAKQGLDSDNDGYQNTSAAINLNANINASTVAEFTALRTEAKNQYDRSAAPFNDHSEKLQQTLGLRLNSDLSEDWSLGGGVNQHRDESQAFDSNPGEFNTKRHGADIKADHFLSETQIVTLGVDYQKDQVSGTSAYLKDKRDNTGVFGQWQAEYGKLGVLAGLRHDDNESFGTENTGNINLGYQLDEKRRLLASYGTAFKAPTFNDLYWPSSPFASGNPNLKPETSESAELGYEVKTKSYHYSARAFITNIDDLIDWACTLNCNDGMWWTDFWQPSNVSSARIKGLELESGFTLANWNGRASLSIIDSRNRDTDKYLANRSPRTLQLDLSRSYYESMTLSASLLAQDERYTNETNTAKLPGYGIVNLNGRYILAKNWAIEAKINNLFDKDYATNASSNGLDRTYLLSVSYNR